MLSPELATELRAARPTASPELRGRVLEVAAREEPPRRTFALPPLRRFVLVAVPAAMAIAVGGAFVHGLAKSGPQSKQSAAHRSSGSAGTAKQPNVGAPVVPRAFRPQTSTLDKSFRAAVPNANGRLQQYLASLRIQVKNLERLSDATKRAMRFARLVGGYVAYVRYTNPAHGRGAASLIVRVPIDRVQDVIAEYSNLGTILAQNVSVVDVTKAVEEEAREIARLKTAIARIEAEGVAPAEEYRLRALQARLAYLTKHRAATVRRAQLARVMLELTTKPTQDENSAPASRFDRTMSGAGGVLLREAEILLYALIVAGPLLLLGLGAVTLGRMQRRRFEQRVLERT
jgi:hypothetical protein